MQFRISVAQINPTTGDLRGNLAKILRAVEKARAVQADIVLLPEMCLTGYCLDEKLLINLEFLRENKRLLMEEIVPACHGVAAVVGFVDFDESRKGPDLRVVRHNSAAIIQDGRLLQIVHKRLLPSYRYFDDKRYFEAGHEAHPVSIRTGAGEIRIGVLICEDLWDEGYSFKPCQTYRERGADYLFCINASPFVAASPGEQNGKRSVREGIIRGQISRHGIPIVWVNTVGIGDNGKNVIPFDGASCAYDREGRLVGQLESFREEQKTIVFEDGLARPVAPPEFDREAEIFQALAMGVRDYYDKVGIFTGVLEAVSGGIDSALGTAIAFEAMGSEGLTLYNLPSRYNSAETQQAARRLAENFGVEYHVVPIQDMVDEVVRDFERYLRPIADPTTIENLQARIRGLIMMAESNDRQALLLTNGNETEIALGYATLYGDMVGGLAVIGDLAKPDVYRLARFANRKWGREMIPEVIFRIPASAELKEDQQDPFDYDVVGPMVSDFIEQGWSPRELLRRFESRQLDEQKYSGRQSRIYERYSSENFALLAAQLYRKLNQSVYKRMQAAPIIVVSERAFGFDLRETIINGWTGDSFDRD